MTFSLNFVKKLNIYQLVLLVAALSAEVNFNIKCLFLSI